MRVLKLSIFLIFLLLSQTLSVYATSDTYVCTNTAADEAGIEAKFNALALTGDTLTLSGTCGPFASGAYVDLGTSVGTAKGFTLQGPATLIIGENATFFRVYGNGVNLARITNLTVTQTDTSTRGTASTGAIEVLGNGTVRLDHITFNQVRAGIINAKADGLADHIYDFAPGAGADRRLYFRNGGDANRGYPSGAQSLALGTANGFRIEDSKFYWCETVTYVDGIPTTCSDPYSSADGAGFIAPGVSDGEIGARAVWRFNEFHNLGSQAMHGTEAQALNVGTIKEEVYYNTYRKYVSDSDRLWHFRSGNGVIHHNTIINDFAAGYGFHGTLTSYRDNQGPFPYYSSASTIRWGQGGGRGYYDLLGGVDVYTGTHTSATTTTPSKWLIDSNANSGSGFPSLISGNNRFGICNTEVGPPASPWYGQCGFIYSNTSTTAYVLKDHDGGGTCINATGTGSVTTSGANVTRISGTSFLWYWAGQSFGLRVGTSGSYTGYTILSVTDADHLVLTTSPATNTYNFQIASTPDSGVCFAQGDHYSIRAITALVDQAGWAPSTGITTLLQVVSSAPSLTPSVLTTGWRNLVRTPFYGFANTIQLTTLGTPVTTPIENDLSNAMTGGPAQTVSNIIPERDYYNEWSLTDPDAYCTNGTSDPQTCGVRVGLFDSRPVACTAGVAYWATNRGGNWNTTNMDANDGMLYRCVYVNGPTGDRLNGTGATEWEDYYTPYTYPDPLATDAPTLSTVSPAFGNKGTTVPVTLTGLGFEGGSASIGAMAGITVNSTTVVSDTSITASFVIDPGATAGDRSVTVTTTDGTSAAQTFEVLGAAPTPTLTAISPSIGLRGRTIAVTLTGTNFTGTPTVTVSGGGITVNNVVRTGSTSITCNFVIANGISMTSRDVTVTTSDGASNTQSFTIYAGAGGASLRKGF